LFLCKEEKIQYSLTSNNILNQWKVSDECNTNQTDYVKVLSCVKSEGLTVVPRIQCSRIGHCIFLHWDQT